MIVLPVNDAVPPTLVAERRQRLLDLERELANTYYRRLVGRRLDVLVEGAAPHRPGFVQGTACRYAPVIFEGYAPALIRRRVPVRAVDVLDGVVMAQPEPESEFAPTTRSNVDRRIPLL